jgi:hypothetical protein
MKKSLSIFVLILLFSCQKKESNPNIGNWYFDQIVDYDSTKIKFPKIILETDSREKNLRDNLAFLKYVRDRKSVFDFLRELQNSGLTNMLAAAPFLTYSSADLKTYIRGQFKDPDEYLDLIDAADKSRDALINGAMKKLDEEGKEDFDLSEVNKEFRNLTRQAMSLYVGNYEAFINRE